MRMSRASLSLSSRVVFAECLKAGEPVAVRTSLAASNQGFSSNSMSCSVGSWGGGYSRLLASAVFGEATGGAVEAFFSAAAVLALAGGASGDSRIHAFVIFTGASLAVTLMVKWMPRNSPSRGWPVVNSLLSIVTRKPSGDESWFATWDASSSALLRVDWLSLAAALSATIDAARCALALRLSWADVCVHFNSPTAQVVSRRVAIVHSITRLPCLRLAAVLYCCMSGG